ncbi:hypothetical protein LUW77_04880 [Streptomyces radiopugnans]|nr:hypothetical protein LUW77_04880 [Streptomyces radiopugnans]
MLAAVALVAAVGFGARAAHSGVVVDGTFDGVGAVIALVSLAVALVAARHGAQALRRRGRPTSRRWRHGWR